MLRNIIAVRTKHVVRLGAVMAFALASHAPGPLQAQAPKPPTDARTVVHNTRAGELKITPEAGKFKASKQAKDFDAVATFVNPSLSKWVVGIEFRSKPNGGMALLVFSDGSATVVSVRDGNAALVKDPVAIPALRKNVNEQNEIALYVRGDKAMVFANKKYVDTFSLGDWAEVGDINLFADSPDKEATGVVKFRNFVVRVPAGAPAPIAAPTTAPNGAAATGNIVIKADRTSYIQWGRPEGMGKPNEEGGCNSFNDGNPVRQFQVSLTITNKSNKVMEKTTPMFFKGGNVPAFWCYYGYRGAGRLEPGQSQNVTFAVFVELNERVESAVFVDEVVGTSNRLLFD